MKAIPATPPGLAPYVFLHSHHMQMGLKCLKEILADSSILSPREEHVIVETMAVLASLKEASKEQIAPELAGL